MKTLFILHEPIVISTYKTYNKISERSEIIIPFIGLEPLEECYYDLCPEAIIVQKRYEFFIIGKQLGIKKITNLNLDEDNIDYDRLVIQLQLYLKLNSISNVVYERYNNELNLIYNKICNKYKIKCSRIDRWSTI